jgi:hypothetical protein
MSRSRNARMVKCNTSSLEGVRESAMVRVSSASGTKHCFQEERIEQYFWAFEKAFEQAIKKPWLLLENCCFQDSCQGQTE